MNEQFSYHDEKMALPQPVDGSEQNHPMEKSQAQAIEQGVVGTSQVTPSVSNAPQSIPTGNASVVPSVQSTAVSTAAIGASTMIADDADLIEKEWVERAKRIVEQTKNDPYRQSEELHATKDEYQMKRFNRDRKTGENS